MLHKSTTDNDITTATSAWTATSDIYYNRSKIVIEGNYNSMKSEYCDINKRCRNGKMNMHELNKSSTKTWLQITQWAWQSAFLTGDSSKTHTLNTILVKNVSIYWAVAAASWRCWEAYERWGKEELKGLIVEW